MSSRWISTSLSGAGLAPAVRRVDRGMRGLDQRRLAHAARAPEQRVVGRQPAREALGILDQHVAHPVDALEQRHLDAVDRAAPARAAARPGARRRRRRRRSRGAGRPPAPAARARRRCGRPHPMRRRDRWARRAATMPWVGAFCCVWPWGSAGCAAPLARAWRCLQDRPPRGPDSLPQGPDSKGKAALQLGRWPL